MVRKANISQIPQIQNIRIVKEKIIIPEFKYKKDGDKQKTTYPKMELEIPDRPGQIVRTYLEKDGAITTKDGMEHELILGEIEIPVDEYEPVDPNDAEKGQKKKKHDKNKFKTISYEIPDREKIK